MALTDEWELFIAQNPALYQMGDGRGRQTLAKMWDSQMRLEHDLQDTTTPNPVSAWLSTAPPGSVAARFWQLAAAAGGAGCIAQTHSTTPCFRDGSSPLRRRGYHSL
eukprot:2139329-Prymnesium_polylepis.1